MGKLIAMLLALYFPAALAQSDYAREKRRADEVVPGLVVGDAIYLPQKSGHKFLAIHTQPPQPRAAVIIVHGLGVHPDWALIGVLRTRLADRGYTTLSVQMPVPAATAEGAEYAPLLAEAVERLGVAAAYLRGKGYRKIGIVSHGLGSRMTNFFLAGAPANWVSAWVSIGVSGEFTEPAKLRAPVLDIYGERDLLQVLEKADARAGMLGKLRGSAQVQVAGADHVFAGRESELLKHVRQFLDLRLR